MSRLALLHPAVIAMGWHVTGVRIRRALFGHRRYPGAAEDILRAGLEACWSGEYLTASPGTYKQFWTRDTGFAAPALVALRRPWPERLLASVSWAIHVWRDRRSHVTTTINPSFRWPIDIFDYGVDSLPLLLASLRSLTTCSDAAVASRAEALVAEHADWLAAEVEWYVDQVVDPATGLVRVDQTFSAHRDTFKNGSTAYANAMVALLARTVAETGWVPDLLSRFFADGEGQDAADGRGSGGRDWSGRDWGSLLRRRFWIGDRFRDRLGTDETSGEANVWPFHLGLIEDRGMLTAALETLRREGYATPYPLKFQVEDRTAGELWIFRLWSPDYQTTTSWTSLGSIYLSLLRAIDPAAAGVELERTRELIERDGTFWEVLDSTGRPWRSASRLSISDTSMLWGAILLATLEQAPRTPAA